MFVVTLVASAAGTGAVRGDDEGASAADAPGGSPPIAVASSLRAVWPALERGWRERLPEVSARPSFGASRTLARQIERGAPFELFLAADELSATSLPAARVHPSGGVNYARGRLALVLSGETNGESGDGGHAADEPDAPGPGTSAGPFPVSRSLEPLGERLAAEPRLRLAIASPSHAPYGIAAREALEASGLWPWPEGNLVVGENAAQTLQFLRAGAVDAALLPLSLLAAGRGAETARPLAIFELDARLHAPLDHRLVALAGASPAALALADWLRGRQARDILLAAGFGESS